MPTHRGLRREGGGHDPIDVGLPYRRYDDPDTRSATATTALGYSGALAIAEALLDGGRWAATRAARLVAAGWRRIRDRTRARG